MASNKKKTDNSNIIALNKKAQHDYFIETCYEAGLMLEGWEVKALRAGRVQLSESHVILKNGEVWLLGSLITPLPTASTHIDPDPTRTRKLLLNQQEVSTLFGSVERKGYTIVPLNMHWKKGKAKLDIALAKGKKKHDKRETEKNRDWARQKQRLLKSS